MPKVSIIVPVHNPGKYLTPLLNSIINQTFTDIEILLIDDGSTDGSRQILKDYESRDNRIKVIFRRKAETERFGEKYSFDLGRTLAQGKYIILVDHDDELTLDAIEKLYAATNNETIDVVQGRNISINEQGDVVYRTPNIWPTVTTISNLEGMTLDNLCYHLVDAPIALWVCLIRRELANSLELADCVFNDTSFIWKLKIAAKTFCYIPDYIYEQHHHDDSTSGSVHADEVAFQIFESFYDLERFLKEQSAPNWIWLLYTIYKFRMEYGHSEGKLSPEIRERYMRQLKIEIQREINITEFIEGSFGPSYSEIYAELMK